MIRQPDHPERPLTPFERRWLETAAETMQFLCRDCGGWQVFRRTDEPCFYECLTCGGAIDERLTYSRRKMARWDPF
jgi:hypothetical protein